MKRRRFSGFRVCVLAAATTIALAMSVTSAQASTARESTLPLAHEASAFLKSTLVWNYHASPAGANVHCTPTAAHPYPVVLVEATFSSMYNAFGAISPYLANHGYCVYAFNYGQTIPLSGIYATGNIAASASQLSNEVNRVLAETGASKVDLVGWSLGGMMPRYYINKLGGASKVNMLVGLASDNYGTSLSGITHLIAKLGLLGIATSLLSVACEACVEQIHNSTFLTHLNRAPTVASVKYVVIQSKHDEVITPYTNAFLPAGPNVQNFTLQDQCRQDSSDHLSIAYDSNALQDVLNALGADNPKFRPSCAAVKPLIGNV
jgi:triacylglycerol esterase/lipase EstA (alpha/beta hydrolase family)